MRGFLIGALIGIVIVMGTVSLVLLTIRNN